MVIPSNSDDRLEEIFHQAISKPADGDRAHFLHEACGNDHELRARVEKLLTAHDATANFLKLPPPLESEQPGSRIGRYTLLQLIGEGGFGSVYLAEQVSPIVRRVAIKIIKLGMDTKQVVARFEAERQALAMMDHPNIATVYDGGATETGRPYFVMELVSGIRITTNCDQHKLSIPQRLELFSQVCQAVQHAHQKGIIHRDLKPGNVLVTLVDSKPVVKVIDFGIAKATQARSTEKTLLTDLRQMIGTPEYMSPEQADGGFDIDTRSDVYALGVLLYELLAGSPPFDPRELRSKAFAEMQRIIREVDPPAPSTRLSASRDTLPSVAAQRAVEPRKLEGIVRGDLDWIVMRCLEKDRERRYETASELVEDIQRFLADEPVLAHQPTKLYRLRKFYQRNRFAFVAGSVILVVTVGAAITSTTLYLRERAARSAADAAQAKARSETNRSQQMVFQLGSRLWSLGDSLVESGHRREAQQFFTEALHIYEQAAREFPEVADFRFCDGIAELKLGEFLLSDGHLDQAAPHLRASIGHLAFVRAEFPGNAHYAEEEINATIVLADAFLSGGRSEQAEQTFRDAIHVLRTSAENGNSGSQDRLGGLYLTGRGVDKDYSEALKWLRRAADQGNKVSQNSVGIMYDQGLGVRSDPAEAAKWYRRSTDQGYSEAKYWLARLYSQGRGVEKDLPKAGALLHEAAQPFRKVLVKADVNVVNDLAWELATNENPSVQDPETAVELAQKAAALEPNDGGILNTLGVAQYRAGNFRAAIKELKQSIEFRNGGDAFDYFFLAMAQQKSGHPDEARTWYEKALASMKAKAPRNRQLIRFRAEAAQTLGVPLPEQAATRPIPASSSRP